MNDINYRCPECGGKLEISVIPENDDVRECQGCTAIYNLVDPALLPYMFTS